MTEAEERLQLLRGAMLHAARDEARGSLLVGMELPDLDFIKARTHEEAAAYLDGQLAGVRQMFLDWRKQEYGG
jgi:hypothetical protein